MRANEAQDRMALEAVRGRRMALDQEPLMHPPVQIEIVPSALRDGSPSNTVDLQLTPPLERTINQITTGKGHP